MEYFPPLAKYVLLLCFVLLVILTIVLIIVNNNDENEVRKDISQAFDEYGINYDDLIYVAKCPDINLMVFTDAETGIQYLVYLPDGRNSDAISITEWKDKYGDHILHFE